jgi:hypothetical protein
VDSHADEVDSHTVGSLRGILAGDFIHTQRSWIYMQRGWIHTQWEFLEGFHFLERRIGEYGNFSGANYEH